MAKQKQITKREEDYSQWYLDVIEAADLAEHSPVKGCMTIKPTGFAIWEMIQGRLDKMFKKTGVQNLYFPLFIPESFMKKEMDHVEGFAPEVAVVTHAGGKKLEENLIVRPTSETIIGEAFARWITSYRDLPLVINQWANVVRWELRTRFFLRTSEFLWQEGHTAHATEKDAQHRALQMLDVYKTFVEEFLAISVVAGEKSESERFAGADQTYTIEAMMQDGKALQTGTSHMLGQNFAKAFEIKYSDENNQLQYVWQTSWGLSTRTIGGIIMTHSDDNGLVLPPRISPVSVVIVPISSGDIAQDNLISQKVEEIRSSLESISDIHDILVDTRDSRPGEKYFEWEKKGIPVRIEIGKKDLENGTVMCYRRDTRQKEPVAMKAIQTWVEHTLTDMQSKLFENSKKLREDNTITASTYDELKQIFEEGNKFVYIPWCERVTCEEKIKDETKATSRCIPFDQNEEDMTCVVCGHEAKKKAIFAKAY